MWTKILKHLRKPSLSTTNMADVLFALATDKNSQDSVIEAAGLCSIEGLNLEKARTETMFLNLCAIYIGVFSDKMKQRHRDKLDSVYLDYVTRFREMLPEFLQTYEARLLAYTKVFDSWYRAHENSRGHEQSLAIGETFFSFCGTACFNAASLAILQHHFFSVIKTTARALDQCRLV
jgi:hypothetical protein